MLQQAPWTVGCRGVRLCGVRPAWRQLHRTVVWSVATCLNRTRNAAAARQQCSANLSQLTHRITTVLQMWRAKPPPTKSKPLSFQLARELRGSGQYFTMSEFEEKPQFSSWIPDNSWKIVDERSGPQFRGYQFSQELAVIPEEGEGEPYNPKVHLHPSPYDFETGLDTGSVTIHLMRNPANETLPLWFKRCFPREELAVFHSSKNINGRIHSIYTSRRIECSFTLSILQTALMESSCKECLHIMKRTSVLFNSCPFKYKNNAEQKEIKHILYREMQPLDLVMKRLADGDKMYPQLRGGLTALGYILRTSYIITEDGTRPFRFLHKHNKALLKML